MKVFMLGWEFPPHISGGLGTACFGLTKGLDAVGVEVSFVLPTAVPADTRTHVTLRTPDALANPPLPGRAAANLATVAGEASATAAAVEAFKHVTLHQVEAYLSPYARPELTSRETALLLEQITQQLAAGTTIEQLGPLGQLLPGALPASLPAALAHSLAPAAGGMPSGAMDKGPGANYAGDLMGQVYRYARLALELSKREDFDVVHAHDWMTYPAGLAVAAATGKPLVVHVHSTEFDRAGESPNQQVYDIERMGMHAAARVVCVSGLTRNIVVRRYGVDPARTDVVYNAVEMPAAGAPWRLAPLRRNEKIVLFLGRLTMQKGPEYFLRAARMVVDRYPNVRFVMAGSGDMITACVKEAADLKLGRYVTFTGFLRGPDVDRAFEMADLYVMPSVSEPFGIAPLEAMSHNVPVLISKQSGVSEVLTHVLKVDFWDVDEMANKILAVLKHPPLQKTLRQCGSTELRKLSWKDSAQKLKDIYCQVADEPR
ncbi:MAG: glycosyltransferase family 4 protein [Planctomycetota bacterium]|nr:glycosyltransferase family 4 protein [Planctomycetota bacterium]